MHIYIIADKVINLIGNDIYICIDHATIYFH